MTRRAVGMGLALLLASSAIARSQDASPDVTEIPDYETFVVVPVRVHVLQAPDLPDVHCALTDDDLARILGKVNAIWHVAGVHFGRESIVREEADERDRFRLARELNPGRAPSRLFAMLRPRASRAADMLHVYYVHEFDVNGFYAGSGFAFVKETAALRAVEGGIDEPIPRVTAHELGHALGLRHRQDTTNQLASGTTGTRLNREEVATARDRARAIPGARGDADLREAARRAESEGRLADASRFWGWLAELPGEGRADAVRERDRLKSVE